MPRTTTLHAVTAIGIDMGKNTLHLIGLDARGAIMLREKVARGRIALRLANLPPCLIGIEAGMATHYVARELAALGHDVKQVPATYAKPFRQGQKNDFRDAHAVAEAVQRPTTRFVPAKTNEQLDLQALHRVRSRLVSERTAVINQIRGFLLERGIVVRQGPRFLRQQLPDINRLHPPSSAKMWRCLRQRQRAPTTGRRITPGLAPGSIADYFPAHEETVA
jgi:transposase